MIIPKKTICDICKKELWIGDRVYKIKHKTILESYGGRITEHGHIDLCGSCMSKFRAWAYEQLKEAKE